MEQDGLFLDAASCNILMGCKHCFLKLTDIAVKDFHPERKSQAALRSKFTNKKEKEHSYERQASSIAWKIITMVIISQEPLLVDSLPS